MTRRSRRWLLAAVIFSMLNLGGGVFAAAQGELLHACAHAGLMVLGALVAWRLAASRSVVVPPGGELTDRLTQLEQAIDAVAIEIERVGEGQRFMTRLLTEHRASGARGEGAAEPIESNARQASPHVRSD